MNVTADSIAQKTSALHRTTVMSKKRSKICQSKQQDQEFEKKSTPQDTECLATSEMAHCITLLAHELYGITQEMVIQFSGAAAQQFLDAKARFLQPDGSDRSLDNS